MTGTERIGWFQPAENPEALRRYGFVVFIDGTRSPLANAQCGSAAGPEGYECLAPLPQMLPGRHVLELATVDPFTAIESPPSAPLELSVMRGPGLASMPAASLQSQPVGDRTCVEGEGENLCYRVEVVASGLTSPDSLIAMRDGRVLMSSGRRRLLVFDDGRLTEMLSVSSRTEEHTELHAVALDADFERSRLMYVAVARTASAGERTISVLRLREVAGTLGEVAAIVPDLPMPPEGRAALAVGPDGQLYLALPAMTDLGVAPSGVILRFDREGKATGHPRVGSAVLAQGQSRPSRLMWDRGRLWLAALGEHPPDALTWIPIETEGDRWPSAPLSVQVTTWPAGGRGVRDFAVVPHQKGIEGTSRVYVVLEKPSALYVADTAGAAIRVITPLRSVPLGTLRPVAVAASPTGDLFVAAAEGMDDSSAGAASSYRLLRLRPEPATAVQ